MKASASLTSTPMLFFEVLFGLFLSIKGEAMLNCRVIFQLVHSIFPIVFLQKDEMSGILISLRLTRSNTVRSLDKAIHICYISIYH